MMSTRTNLTLAVTAALFAACGTSQPAPERNLRDDIDGAPAWAQHRCSDGLHGKKGICGAQGAAHMTDISLARSTAEARARVELARKLQLRLKAMIKDYKGSTTAGPERATASEQHVREASEHITKIALAGTEIEDTWISKNGTYWVLVSLDVDAFKGIVRGMKDLDESLRTAVIDRADKAFTELDRATAE